MPFVANPGAAKVEIVAHHSTTLIPIVNVFGIAGLLTPTLTDEATWCTAIRTAIEANTAGWANEWIGDYVQVTDLNTATGPQATQPFTAGTVGTAGVGDPPNSCFLVKHLTVTRGRSFRGRSFFSPIAHSSIDPNGGVDSSPPTNFGAMFSAIDTALLGTTPPSNRIVISRHLHTNADVVNDVYERLIASQRRRINR